MRHDEENTPTTRIAIIVGSTRPGRRAATVAEWVRGEAERLVACAPCELQHELLCRTLREVTAWAGALRTLRTGVPA